MLLDHKWMMVTSVCSTCQTLIVRAGMGDVLVGQQGTFSKMGLLSCMCQLVLEITSPS